MAKLQAGIAIPPKTRSGPKSPKWIDTVRGMQVGDSFLMPGKKPGESSAYASYWRRVTGYKFTTRSTNDGVRVWRVE